MHIRRIGAAVAGCAVLAADSLLLCGVAAGTYVAVWRSYDHREHAAWADRDERDGAFFSESAWYYSFFKVLQC